MMAGQLAWAALQASQVVTDTLVQAVAQIESGGGRFTIGDNGKANGWWHMHAAAWRETTAWRRQQALPIWSYSAAHDPAVARLYARDYLSILEKRLSNRFDEVTPEMIYAAYNIGFSRFQQRGFLIQKTPRTTQAACIKLKQFLGALAAQKEKATPTSRQI